MPSFNIHCSRVLKALTRKFKLSEDVSLYSIAKKCPPNFTGADMYALCADAWFQAAKRKVSASWMTRFPARFMCIMTLGHNWGLSILIT